MTDDKTGSNEASIISAVRSPMSFFALSVLICDAIISFSAASLGSLTAFVYAMHRPDLFSAACPLSAYNGPRSVEQLQRETRFVNGVLDQETALTFLSHYNTLELIEKTSVSDLSSVRWYIDCGDDDFLYESNSLVHIALRQKNVKHEFRIRDGGHTWTYWRSALPEVLLPTIREVCARQPVIAVS